MPQLALSTLHHVSISIRSAHAARCLFRRGQVLLERTAHGCVVDPAHRSALLLLCGYGQADGWRPGIDREEDQLKFRNDVVILDMGRQAPVSWRSGCSCYYTCCTKHAIRRFSEG